MQRTVPCREQKTPVSPKETSVIFTRGATLIVPHMGTGSRPRNVGVPSDPNKGKANPVQVGISEVRFIARPRIGLPPSPIRSAGHARLLSSSSIFHILFSSGRRKPKSARLMKRRALTSPAVPLSLFHKGTDSCAVNGGVPFGSTQALRPVQPDVSKVRFITSPDRASTVPGSLNRFAGNYSLCHRL